MQHTTCLTSICSLNYDVCRTFYYEYHYTRRQKAILFINTSSSFETSLRINHLRFHATRSRISTSSMDECATLILSACAKKLICDGVCNIPSAAMDETLQKSLSELVTTTVGNGTQALETKGITVWDEHKPFRFKVLVAICTECRRHGCVCKGTSGPSYYLPQVVVIIQSFLQMHCARLREYDSAAPHCI